MKKIDALIVDDEILNRKTLELLLKENCPDIGTILLANSASQAREILKEHPIDLIFLDIAMPKESGFDFLKSLTKIDFSIIFTTAYSQYGIKAIKANALDYILKPISPIELIEAVEKAKKLFSLKNREQPVNNLINQIDNPNELITNITIPTSDGYKLIQLKNIVYFEASNNYTHINVDNCEQYIIAKTLKEIDEYLSDVKYFLRVHKSYIVNMEKVEGYNRDDGINLTLCCGNQLPVSRRRQADFFKFIKK